MLVGITLLLLILATIGAPYVAVAFERIGSPVVAEKLYSFTVWDLARVNNSLAPGWAWSRLAALDRDTESAVQLARLARQEYTQLSVDLYERAIPAGNSAQRLDWLEEYAAVLPHANSAEAARALFAAAGIAANAGDRDRAVRDIESSLTFADVPNVRWQEARMLMNARDARAVSVLQEIVNRNSADLEASRALGLLLWERGDTDEAAPALKNAARNPRYRAAWQAFQKERDANQRLQHLSQDRDTQTAAVQRDHEEAREQHRGLYDRLHQFECDARQFSNWEAVSDQQIAQGCAQIRLNDAINRIAVLGLLFVPVLGELGEAAEAGVLGEAGAAAEAGAASEAAAGEAALSAEAMEQLRAAATMEERFAVLSTDELRNGGANAVDRSIAERKKLYWKVIGTRFTAHLELEQNFITQEIEGIFELRQTKITQYFEPREANAQRMKESAEEQRGRLVATVTESRPVFKVKLGRVRLDGSSQDCKGNQRDTDSEHCQSGVKA
jgi:hypothetical protein